MKSQLLSALDDMEESVIKSLTLRQITRLMVGYFSAVEAWNYKNDEFAAEMLKEFHAEVRSKLTGGVL